MRRPSLLRHRSAPLIGVADGKIEFRGNFYDSCSTAAELAREVVTGRQ
jgi:hypothetical protein